MVSNCLPPLALQSIPPRYRVVQGKTGRSGYVSCHSRRTDGVPRECVGLLGARRILPPAVEVGGTTWQHGGVEHADFVVIGAGIAGASAAYRLARHGKVVVLERERAAGYHTTGRSAALFTESFEIGVVRQLAMASRSFFEQPPVGFTAVALLAPLPFLLIGREDQLGSLNAALEADRDIPGVSRVGSEEARTLCPALRPGYAVGGIYEAGAKSLDVDALL